MSLKYLHNQYHGTAPEGAIYIGRGSYYGNPYIIGKDGDRDDVCDLFEKNIIPNLDVSELRGKHLMCFCKPARCHGIAILKKLYTTKWQRFGGYEVSSKGDKRFSALFARMPDGRTIEQHYQCDVKGYDPGGTDWKLGKGNPPVRDISPEDLYIEYKKLWEEWSEENIDLMRELYFMSVINDNTLSDRFATSPVNQARALSEILTKLCTKGEY